MRSQARCKVSRGVKALGRSPIGVRLVPTGSTDDLFLLEVERVQAEHVDIGRICTLITTRCCGHTGAKREQLRARLHHQTRSLERLGLRAGRVHALQLGARQPTPAGQMSGGIEE